jgi:hypothetical protein
MSQYLTSTARNPEQEVALRRHTNNVSLLNELFPVFHAAQDQSEPAQGATKQDFAKPKATVTTVHALAKPERYNGDKADDRR